MEAGDPAAGATACLEVGYASKSVLGRIRLRQADGESVGDEASVLRGAALFRYAPPAGDALLVLDATSRVFRVYRCAGGELEAVAVLGSEESSDESASATEQNVDARFSPRGTFVATFARVREQQRDCGTRVRIYRAAVGEPVLTLSSSLSSTRAATAVQWTADEALMFHAAGPEIRAYVGTELARGYVARLRVPGLQSFAVAPCAVPAANIGISSDGSPPPTHYLAAFSAQSTQSTPARLLVFSYPGSFTATVSGASTAFPGVGHHNASLEPLVSRSLFRVQDAEFYWSPRITPGATTPVLLVKTSTDDDPSGKSYYGESRVHYLSLVADAPETAMPDGPIHDVAWAPNGREFIIVHGYAPARATLYHARGAATFEFGTGSRNRVCWSPHGRFLALAGFGNLPGPVQIWDRNKKRVLGEFQAECTTAWAWSPCSRYFMTAVTHPRMKVDNGLRVFGYDGRCVFERRFHPDWLYQVEWRPVPENTYPDRPASPRVLQALRERERGSHGNGEAGNAERGAYIPPHLRAGRGSVPGVAADEGVMAAAPAFRLHEHEAPRKVEPSHTLTKSQLKNRKRKEREARKRSTASDAPST
ncbi:hypothetical protein CDCA_CDCA03G0841 [Cyanidium caldarium]|uniref:Eukaryotic translation initiation factor 2A n=1 Tax=Cyanidium caldarium TaxID=2771 RepID=A0AAV9IRJ6_CYACA|nr:hypothetical protein CDCA_CDCA03G0841 [Cyanidium caldarium]